MNISKLNLPIVQRGKWLARSILGRDVYFRRQIKVPIIEVGGRPETGFGAWSICGQELDKDSIVYSLGIGDDISFDLGLIRKFKLSIEAFDPTPQAHAWLAKQKLPAEFHAHQFGIAKSDGHISFFAHQNEDWIAHSTIQDVHTASQPIVLSVKRLSTVMKSLGHNHIDLLKIDIEGAEYEVIDTLWEDQIDVRQLVVEFHHRFPAISTNATRRAVNQLNLLGLCLFTTSASGEEYSFLKQSPNSSTIPITQPVK